MVNKDKNFKIKTKHVLWLLVIVIIIWGVSALVLSGYEDRGTFGDMFGAVNALFSGLAFVGVICAILLQRQELELQREELEQTREEIKGQKLQLKAQNETLKLQRFENTFFQLLGLHNDIVNSIDIRKQGNVTVSARDCFSVFYNRCFRAYRQYSGEYPDKSESEKVNDAYLAQFRGIQDDVGHYFRNLYHIVKFVKNSEVEKKKLYTNLIRAQLSSFELGLLFYNCLSVMGKEKFKPLVEEFALLKNLDKDILLNKEHVALYGNGAFVSD